MNRLALTIILAGAAGLRLFLWTNHAGPLWFEEAVPVVWAQRLWGFERGHIDLNPHSVLWPHLSAYVFFVVQLLQYVGGRITGAFHSLPDFRASAFLDPELLRGSAMLAEIAIGLGAIVAAGRLATRLAGPWMGLAVAFLLALEPLHVRYSLVPGPDMLLALFVSLGLVKAIDVLERGYPSDSVLAGLYTGLGIATKYTPVLLFVPLALAHAWSHGQARGRRFALCITVAIGAFAATSPFTWLDLSGRRAEIGAELAAFVQGSFGASTRPAALSYAIDALPRDLGWPLALLAGAALFAALFHLTRERLLLLAYALPFALTLGLATAVYERYLLPLLPVLLALVASGMRAGLARPALRRGVAVAGAIGVLGLVWSSVQYVREARAVESRSLAREWIESFVAPGSLIAREPAGPRLRSVDEQMELAGLPDLAPDLGARLGRTPAFSLADIPMTVHDPDATHVFYDLRDLAGFDVVVVSGSVRSRYLAEPARFPVQADFYEGLDRFWSLHYRTPSGSAKGPDILIYSADSARAAMLEAWWRLRAVGHEASPRHPTVDVLAPVFAGRALCLTRAGRFEHARRLWPTALLWDRAPAPWWYGHGISLAATGHGVEAYDAFREAYRRDPRLTEAGLFAAEQALLNGAIAECRRTLTEVTARGGLSAWEQRRADSLAIEIASRPETPDSEVLDSAD